MPSSTKVLYVALDACDAKLARRFIADGDLPVLARLLETSAVAETEAPVGMFVSSHWPTIFTGCDAVRHGYHCWNEYVAGTYSYRETSPKEITLPPFWSTLSDEGRRVAIVDVPHTAAVEGLNGIQLVEWGCHDRHLGTHSWPATLAAELDDTFGRHPVGGAPSSVRPGVHHGQLAPCDYVYRAGPHRTAEEAEALLADLLKGAERKRAASLALLDRGGWDLFMTVLGESHCVGHQFWAVHDPTHPRHDPALAARLGDPVRQVYRALDATLGAHLDQIDDDTTVFVHLTHGMGPHYDGTHLLDPVLRRLESWVGHRPDLDGATGLIRTLTRPLPGPLRRAGLQALGPLLKSRLTASPGSGPGEVPLHDRFWFETPNNTPAGGIRLNLEGREPRGRIQAADYRAVCEWLRDRLLELVNVDTGRLAVDDVVITDDAYHRSLDDPFPDLFVEWSRASLIERAWSPSIGLVEVAYDHWRTGDHDRDGLLLVQGPSIAPGPRPGRIPAVDIAPTVAATLGVTLPYVDGRPRLDLFTREAAAPGGSRPSAADRPWNSGPTRSSRVLAAVRDVDRGVRRLHRQIARTDETQRATRLDLDRQASELNSLRESTDRLHVLASITTVSTWIRNADVPAATTVSVVMPTRNRVDYLADAIESVRSQSYGNWELVVVDDGSTDDTPKLLASFDDPRIRSLETEGVGCAAARNLAIAAATGDVLAYLDDDNRFDRDWLRSVVWALNTYPDVDVVYGARLVDSPNWYHRPEELGLPALQLLPWDRKAVEEYNRVDMNVLAHRVAPARFDERFDYFADWDLLLKLTDEKDPLPLPVVATYYTTTAPDRLSAELGSERLRKQYDEVVTAMQRRLGR